MENRKIWTYDIEIFPNFFLLVALNFDTGEWRIFVLETLNDLRIWLKTEVKVLVGFNSHDYDDNILRYIISKKYVSGEDITHSNLFDFSAKLTSDDKSFRKFVWKELIKKIPFPFQSIDLYKLHHFDRSFTGLKHVAVMLKWPLIKDLPAKWDEPIDDLEECLFYCVNDVGITNALLTASQKELRSRKLVQDTYGLNVISKSRTAVGDTLLTKMYADYTRQNPQWFRKQQTIRKGVPLRNVISDKVKFTTESMQIFLEEMKEFISWPHKDGGFHEDIRIGDTSYTIKEGGIHDKNKDVIWESNQLYTIMDYDFGSYYPNLMITLGIYPAHLNDFLPLFKRIVDQRLKAKAEGDKSTSDILKIVINSIYGKLQEENSWLLDRQAQLGVCMNGQLYILMIIEALEAKGIKVIYANTDGWSVYCPNERIEECNKICQEFADYFNIPLEYERYDRFVISNVNAYLWIKDNYTKLKGDMFTTNPDLSKGFNYPVVSIALLEYFINGTDPLETLHNHDNVLDFAIAKKSAKKFRIYYRSIVNGEYIEEEQQKTNRYIVTNRATGKLVKVDSETGKEYTFPNANRCMILNDCQDINPKSYPINYNFYAARVWDDINKINRNFQTVLL